MTKIDAKLSELPKSPGVYQFLDANGDILYVGKAKNLRNRVRSYFAKEIGRGPAIEIMVQNAVDLKHIETESEIEAVLLEAELIKKIRPKYNIQLKDDKSFLVVKITKERFPCVELVRFKNINMADKTCWYFGPYPSGGAIKRSIKFLRKVFPFRDCFESKYHTYYKRNRPCIYGDIGLCTACCASRISEEGYNRNIVYLKNFLRGRKNEVIAKLEKEMESLSKKMQFEEAAKVRNQLYALNHLKDVAVGVRDDLFDSGGVLFKRIECYDISNNFGQYAVGSMVVFSEGKKDTDNYRKFKIKYCDESPNDTRMLAEVLFRRFKNDWPLPDLVVIDGGAPQLEVGKRVIFDMGLKIPIISIAKGAKRDKNELHFSSQDVAKFFKNNTALQNTVISARDEAHRFAISYYRKLHNKGIFNK